MAAAKRYTAFCTRCYNQRLDNVGKREAERWCVSHMNAYGHDCTILPYVKRNPPRARARRTRRNPPLVTFGNPPRGKVMSRRVYAVAYKHAGDGKAYKHDFQAGVCLEALPDGSIRIYSMRGKRLWGDF